MSDAKGVVMGLQRLVLGAALVFGSGAIYAAQVPSAVYNGLDYGKPKTHSGPAVRVARPGHFKRSDERHRGDDERHRGSESGGYGS